MLEGLVNSVGLTNLVLIIVGVALLLVVVLLMSYFRVLVAISHFTFPNATFRAHGTPYLKKEKVNPLIEGGNLNEIYSEIRFDGYDVPKEVTEDLDEVERRLEKSTLKMIKKAYRASPQESKGFVESWLYLYDVKMAKKAVKAMAKGRESKELEDRLFPVRIIDERIIEDLVSARNLQETFTILKGTEFGEVLGKKEWEGEYFLLDVALDRFAFKKLKSGVMKVDSEQRDPVKRFFGKYTDILNIKIILRGIREGVDEDTLKDSLMPAGRELEDWKLEQMVESKNLDEALVELEGTSYEEIRKEGAQKGPFEVEKYLDTQLLQVTSEIMSQYVLTIGPLLKFLVGKDIELRNLKVMIRGLKEGVDVERIRNMMILEEYS